MNSLMLREVNAHQTTLKRYANTTGRRYQTLTSSTDQDFVHITAMLSGHTYNLYCDMDKLLYHSLPMSEVLPVELIDKHLLIGLARRYFCCHGLLMPVSQKPVDHFDIQGILNGTQIAYPLVSMDPTEGVIWAELADITVPTLPKIINGADWSHLILQMKVSLGYTLIHYTDIVELCCGDLFILEVPTCTAIIANAITMKFKIDEDNMMVDSMEEYDASTIDESISLVNEKGLTMDNLELKVEFFLEERNMTLAELQNIHANECIPLQTIGEKVNVNLRVGRKIIASGELVRVDDRLAVEIYKINGTL
ncbi:FliM/FliN family flagellar motor switch protein [Citrobacter freundii]|nr:FliM/FliN family flagellar motor switch protein [Citrobacter freundii]